MVEALEYAFESIIPRNAVDTVYLLSDGQTSDLGNKDLHDLVLGLNEETDATIHTVFINTRDIPVPIAGQPKPLRLTNSMTSKAQSDMAQIAKYSGGSFPAIE